MWFFPAALNAQVPNTTPVDGLRDHTPLTYAWKRARIVVRSGVVIPRGTLVIKDGVILSVGADAPIPPGARILDGSGKTLYPGFIDAFDSQKIPTVSSGSPHWNPEIQPQRSVASRFKVDSKRHAALRRMGIVARLAVPKSGILQGTSALVATSDEPIVLNENVALHAKLTVPRGRERDEYPNSPMGAVALARQTFLDARWYEQAWSVYSADSRVGRPEKNDSLVALLPYLSGKGLVIFDCPNHRDSLRADRFAREFNLKAALLGSGNEYRRLAEIAAAGRPIIVPVAFPKAPDVGAAESARTVPLQDLLHWDLAPENPAKLQASGLTLAVTTWGSEPREFLGNVRKAVKRGWKDDDALHALTLAAAQLLGADAALGSLEPGKLGSLIVTDGDWSDPKTKILETWVMGHRHRHKKPPIWNPTGRWELRIPNANWTLNLRGGPAQLKGRLWPLSPDRLQESKQTKQANRKKTKKKKPQASESPSGVALAKVSVVDDRLALLLDGKSLGRTGMVRISLVRIAEIKGPTELIGQVTWPDGSQDQLTAKKLTDGEDVKPDEDDEGDEQEAEESPSEKSSFAINFPLGAFGLDSQPKIGTWTLFRGGTVWTCGQHGTKEGWDVLVRDKTIVRIGKNLSAPDGAEIFDCRGKHLTPGIVDCHSHMATDGGVNESTQAITAEVRIGDFINGDDIAIYRQLAGGVTTSNILHGSANPIGGQNQVIKLRWGTTSEIMKFSEAPSGIKFALGENVKQSNWGDEYTTRYPQTRMGVEQIVRDAFHEAKRYSLRWRQWKLTHRGLPPRRDLELEALAEILEHQRWIHCHSYRQDEILALLRTLDDFGVTIGSLQHILEGYKVADAMKTHGATASSFSDWWAYKFEVYDAIPYNGALMHKVGLSVSFNSDDREMARHLNHEAAKAVKYGGVDPEEALKFVTLNPAGQLRIDRWVGSLEKGKHADIVIWSGPPLSTLSRCEQTWIDGRKYFDYDQDLKQREKWRQMRQTLIQKILKTNAPMLKAGEKNPTRDQLWPRDDLFCRCRNHRP